MASQRRNSTHPTWRITICLFLCELRDSSGTLSLTLTALAIPHATANPTPSILQARENGSSTTTAYPLGISIDTKRCDSQTVDRLERTILDIRHFAQIATAAIDSQPDLYNYFFKPEDRDIVKKVFSNLELYTKSQGTSP